MKATSIVLAAMGTLALGCGTAEADDYSPGHYSTKRYPRYVGPKEYIPPTTPYGGVGFNGYPGLSRAGGYAGIPNVGGFSDQFTYGYFGYYPGFYFPGGYAGVPGAGGFGNPAFGGVGVSFGRYRYRGR